MVYILSSLSAFQVCYIAFSYFMWFSYLKHFVREYNYKIRKCHWHCVKMSKTDQMTDLQKCSNTFQTPCILCQEKFIAALLCASLFVSFSFTFILWWCNLNIKRLNIYFFFIRYAKWKWQKCFWHHTYHRNYTSRWVRLS